MGIAGLLPALKPIQVTRHLSELAGQAIAVDAYVWLHKGIYSCATELATGKPTHKYVDYAMHRVRLLRHYKIEPYIVFDGGPLPAKQGTERERKQRRDEYLARGKALASQGKHAQAREFFVKCVDVTPQMAYQLIKVQCFGQLTKVTNGDQLLRRLCAQRMCRMSWLLMKQMLSWPTWSASAWPMQY